MNDFGWVGLIREHSVELVDEGAVVDEAWLGWHPVAVDNGVYLVLAEADVEGGQTSPEL